MNITKLPSKKMGHLLMLGNTIDKQVWTSLIELRGVGGIVNRQIAIASARAIARRKDSNMLAENGGHVVFTKDWAHYVLVCMGYVKRKDNTKAKIAIENFEELKTNYLYSIKGIMMMEEIPPPLIVNWDHTGLKCVPVSSWTMEKQGSKEYLLLESMTNVK